ncbi:MAG: hypothetical protein LLG02_13240 [Pelosinus sp.]|nr:hypothetical protein [Pelosinus sp.]
MNKNITLGDQVKPSKQQLYRYCIAVTSSQGKLVDQSCGDAAEFLIYHFINHSFILAEVRSVEDCHDEAAHDYHYGKERVTAILADCDVLLTRGIGRVLQKKMLSKGVLVLEYCYTVDSGLRYAVGQLCRQQVI